jgi:hypothetical protein
MDVFGSSKSSYLVLIDCLEKFGLEFRFEFADFVEKEGAVLSDFEKAFLPTGRSRKSAFLKTKQLAFN